MAESDLSVVSYVLGILSIVFAFFTPIAGLVLGIVGFAQSKRLKTSLGKKAKKFNIIGIILSVIILIISVVVLIYSVANGISTGKNFPIF